MRSKIFLLVFVIASILSFRLNAHDAMFYLKYADKGDTEAMFRCLAGSYRYGRGCVPDQSLASYYTEQAAKYGDEGSKRATGIIRKEL